MSKRLQVLLDEKELRQIRRIAERNGTTVAEWVRAALRREMRSESGSAPDKKLAAVRRAAQHEYPTAPIDQMLAEIERGYLEPPEE